MQRYIQAVFEEMQLTREVRFAISYLNELVVWIDPVLLRDLRIPTHPLTFGNGVAVIAARRNPRASHDYVPRLLSIHFFIL